MEFTDPITVFMATYPGGFDNVADAVRSLLQQSLAINKLVLHVNGTRRPPRLPKDPRLVVRLSETNHADNGKFVHMRGTEGYILTADDDIDYPHDYVERMVHEVEKRTAMVGVHGNATIWPTIHTLEPIRQHASSHVFALEHGGRIPVDVIGTGTMAFHSKIGIDIEAMDTLRMVDLHVAHWAAKKSVNMHMVPRKRDWLVEFDGLDEQRIWQQTKADKERT